MNILRRDFLMAGAGIAAFAGTAAKTVFAQDAQRRREPRIGIQLYCVRGEFDKDVPGTIKKLAEIGYQGVEFYGYDGTENVFKNYSAERLKAILDENNIRCCGIHLTVNALQGDAFERTIKNMQVLRNRYLIVASANNLMDNPESIKKFAGILNEASKKARESRMLVGYHCHGFDFKKMGDSTGWDILFSQVDPEVIMQMDTGNCAEGGGDPIAILKKFPNRASTVHVKEYEGAPLKEDNPKWKEIIRICKEQQRTRWYTIEQGEAAGTGFDIARESFETLKKML